MRILKFRIVNVFTRGREALSGNPLCVFEDGQDLDTASMQALARQFNLSETTFILRSAAADARVRIFTPTYEMPFAGHPTLGTAFVCRALGLGGSALTLEMPAGIIAVRAAGDRWTLMAQAPTWRELELPRAGLAQALGLDPEDIADRPLWVKAGKEQLVVPLVSEAAVRRTAPRADALLELPSEDGISMAYVFAMSGDGRASARFFFPQGTSMIEDPATGSATANFGGWMLAMQRTLPIAVEISQGEHVQRPSTLYLSVDARRQIEVGGEVVQVGAGVIEL
jgi:trans-2,3-dihydro-3-hydroxyanthranilate isomerase